jgi:hypothetical protein
LTEPSGLIPVEFHGRRTSSGMGRGGLPRPRGGVVGPTFKGRLRPDRVVECGRAVPGSEGEVLSRSLTLLPIRVGVSMASGFTALMQQVRAACANAARHSVPCETLEEALRDVGAAGIYPLINFTSAAIPRSIVPNAPGIIEPVWVPPPSVRKDRQVAHETRMVDDGCDLRGGVSYLVDRYRAATIRRFAELICGVLDRATGRAARKVGVSSSVSVTSGAGRGRLEPAGRAGWYARRLSIAPVRVSRQESGRHRIRPNTRGPWRMRCARTPKSTRPNSSQPVQPATQEEHRTTGQPQKPSDRGKNTVPSIVTERVLA